MGAKIRKITLSLLAAGLAAAVFAPPAEANRGTPTTTTTEPRYVPPPVTQDVPGETAPPSSVIPVELPAVTDPGAGLAGGGITLAPVAGGDAPAEPVVLDQTATRPEPAKDGPFGGILSRTGAESLPLARAGLGAVALGLGLVVLARRRQVDGASA